MGFWTWAGIVVIALFFVGWIFVSIEEKRTQAAYRKSKWSKIGRNPAPPPPSPSVQYGMPNPDVVCSHCQTKGHVLTKPIKKKNGISGAKATGAILTGGVSLLATGLSQKDLVTQAHCSKCSSTWIF